ncbi:sodium-dependent phosphate transporter 1-A-like isoform X2 [Dreissena polymorpha]|uniref:sodium-dependent phosphate transporter 1-A-like isoform X2 n=1 Tax=Dreissena polymorpha TaxID=45954 RepID=UPI0022640F0E|nr:sodium-dependent phosphate transporter 1-A-like isoform X2 [Dreissena polymorpha]
MLIYEESWLWIVVVGFIIAFVLAFGVGANDVANSFGTSVGAKVITVRQACILGSIFEMLGAILVGSKVSDTIRKGIISPDIYTNGTEDVFLAGNLAALTGSCIWMLVATFFKLPVSSTHSVVGATIGFSLVVNGVRGIGWGKLGLIAASWFVSPVLSGIVSSALFKLIDIVVLKKEKPLEPGLRLLPLFYALTIAVNSFSVFYKGSEMLYFDKIPLYGTMILTFGSAIITAIFVVVIVVPIQRRRILKTIDKELIFEEEALAGNIDKDSFLVNGDGKKVDEEKKDDSSDKDFIDAQASRRSAREKIQDKPEVARLFTFLQVLTAIFGSFAHGGNDVSNAIGPLIALWITATTGSAAQKAPVPIWVLCYGGVGISVGIWVWGRRVMKTIGENLSKITPSSGFCIEVGSALTVLVASNLGVPISTTHCKVGSVVFVGRVRSNNSVDWKLFKNIVLAWIVTVPASVLLSALSMFGLHEIVKATR